MKPAQLIGLTAIGGAIGTAIYLVVTYRKNGANGENGDVPPIPPGEWWTEIGVETWLQENYPYYRKLDHTEMELLELLGSGTPQSIAWVAIQYAADGTILHVRTFLLIFFEGSDKGDLDSNIYWVVNDIDALIGGINSLTGYCQYTRWFFWCVSPKLWHKWTLDTKFTFMALAESAALLTEPYTDDPSELSARRYFHYQAIEQTKQPAYLFADPLYKGYWMPIIGDTQTLPDYLDSRASSIKVAPGNGIELYSEQGFYGDSFRAWNDLEDLRCKPGFNDRARSAKILTGITIEDQLYYIKDCLERVWVYRAGSWLYYDPQDQLGSDLKLVYAGEVLHIKVTHYCILSCYAVQWAELFPDQWNEVVWNP